MYQRNNLSKLSSNKTKPYLQECIELQLQLVEKQAEGHPLGAYDGSHEEDNALYSP